MFGLSSYSTETSTSSSTPGYIPSTISNDGSGVFVGLGAYYLVPFNNSLIMYVGPKFGLSFLSSSSEQPYYGGPYPSTNTRDLLKTKETDFIVGAGFGAEYFPFAQFSVGGEFQFNYTSFGNPDRTRTITPPPSPPPTSTTSERKQHLWNTDALFFVRWYFVQTSN